jgi:hypothetical protein
MVKGGEAKIYQSFLPYIHKPASGIILNSSRGQTLSSSFLGI